MKIAKGETRWTLLVWRYAFKIPSLQSWGRFVNGLLNNMYEATNPHPKTCPIIWRIPGGLCNVMPRCSEVKEIKRFTTLGDYPPFVEFKNSSFGYYNGKIVVVDWGKY